MQVPHQVAEHLTVTGSVQEVVYSKTERTETYSLELHKASK
jgi:acylphosphatase